MMLEGNANRLGKGVPGNMAGSRRRERTGSVVGLVANEPCPSCAAGDLIDDPDLQRAANKIIRFCDEKKVTVVGITGCEPNSDVSRLVEVIATCYRQIGRRVTVIDATTLSDAPDTIAKPRLASDARCDCTVKVDSPDMVEDIRNVAIRGVEGDPAACLSVGGARDQAGLVLVALPPVLVAEGAPCDMFRSVAPMCQMSLLTCLTGQVSLAVLRDCVVQCDIHKVRLGGLILNDQKFAGGRWLANS